VEPIHDQGDMYSDVFAGDASEEGHPLRAIRGADGRDIAGACRRCLMRCNAGGAVDHRLLGELLRAQLLQMLYRVPSERLLMEEIDHTASC